MQDTLFNFSQEISNKSKISKEESANADVVIPSPASTRSASRSQHNSRRVVPTRGDSFSSSAAASETIGEAPAAIRTVEKVLKNGDLYSGGLSGGAPHGKGKYLWSDGCMYEREWRLGKAGGKGRFSWPSGATYEGDFKDGRMDGEGTFIGADGDTYRGHWLWERKHGYGEKRYANGDVYQGNWKANLQDGHGRYVWNDGNEYVGEWKNGVIFGKGVLSWANGNKYEGFWENGVPKGKGLFTWPNENRNSTHLGIWGRKKKKESMAETMGGEMTQKLFSIDSASRNINFPRICIWELDGEAGDITCDFVGDVEAASMYSRDTSESDVGDNTSGGGDTDSVRSPWWFDRGGAGGSGATCVPRSPRWLDQGDVKKPGEMLTFGHKNYDLMLNLQLGIRYSAGKHASTLRELRPNDFDPKEKFWTRFPPEGSKYTPPHLSVDFKWKDYCPMVFRHLRELFAVDPADYMLAICGNESLREFCSPGKSGSCFYLTQDERFMIKTVKKSEIKVLIKMLPNYYKHVCEYKNALVTKFFGVHCVKPVGGQKTRFIVMGNLFCSEYRIHKRFDLKGSSHGRTTDKPECEIDETTTLKDLDLKYVFRLESPRYQEFIQQIDNDCEFLEAEKIMDYSLLIGLHFRDDCLCDDMSLTLRRREMHRDDTAMRGYHSLPNMDWVMEGREPLIMLGANTPAKAERVTAMQLDHFVGSRSTDSTPKNCSGEVFEVILYFGIIDILQDYDISKKIEHAYKSLHADSTSISAVDPKLYSRRFKEFIHKIFLEEA